VVKDIYVLKAHLFQRENAGNHSNLEVTEMQEDYNSAMANIEYFTIRIINLKKL
jgi:cobalt-zinc-cadmium efflux system membrane fusion protein